jgi:hypothetical protein
MKSELAVGVVGMMLVMAGCLGRSGVIDPGSGADQDSGPGPYYFGDSGPEPYPYDYDSGPDPYFLDGGPDPYPWDGGPDPYPYDGGPGIVDASPSPKDAGPKQDACALFAFYADADGDGFGDPQVAVLACSAPAGYVANSADCYDGNGNAHPGQASFFSTDRGDGSFDYDCNGQADQELRNVDPQFCVCGNGCSVSTGWRGAIPACGESGNFAVGGDGKTCDAIIVPVTQPCR